MMDKLFTLQLPAKQLVQLKNAKRTQGYLRFLIMFSVYIQHVLSDFYSIIHTVRSLWQNLASVVINTSEIFGVKCDAWPDPEELYSFRSLNSIKQRKIHAISIRLSFQPSNFSQDLYLKMLLNNTHNIIFPIYECILTILHTDCGVINILHDGVQWYTRHEHTLKHQYKFSEISDLIVPKYPKFNSIVNNVQFRNPRYGQPNTPYY